MNINNLIGTQEKCCVESTQQVASPSILDNLKRRKMHIEEQLGRVNAAIEALESNPETARVLELVARTNY